MTFKTFVILAIAATLIVFMLLSWLVPTLFKIVGIVAGCLMLYVGARVLMGPRTPVPEAS